MESSVTLDQIKELRQKTNAPMGDCKKALQESGADFEKATEWLRAKGKLVSGVRSDKVAQEGKFTAYIHQGRIAVMLEINCETDFVARSDDFVTFCREVALQIAASAPLFVNEAQSEFKPAYDKEVKFHEAQLDPSKLSKPEMKDKILTGKMKKWRSEVLVMEQPWIKDPKRTLSDLLSELTGKVGEKIVVTRFNRWVLGETSQ